MPYTHVKSLEFDLITSCNAYCPGCVRYEVHDSKMYRNPLIDFNVGLDVGIIESIVSSETLHPQAEIDFVGLAGDAIAHPQFLEIIKIVKQHRPQAKIQIHTNGGLRDPAFFQELASLLSDHTDIIGFSIDGLADTNHIYRIRVDYYRAIENMRAFSDAGGRAIWQFVEFPWNSHQIEQARQLADEYGLYEFVVRPNGRELEEITTVANAAKNGIVNKKRDVTISDRRFYGERKAGSVIQDECVSDEKIYINNVGEVVPCCIVNSMKIEIESQKMNDYVDFMQNEDGWNNLNKHSFDTIMRHPWWSQLEQDIKTKPHGVCAGKCGFKCA